MPKNCGMAGEIGIVGRLYCYLVFTFSSLSLISSPSVLSLGLCDTSVNGQAIKPGGKKAMARDS